ncbi:MAG TPA: putative sugar nucleotidyl transferase [Candidatus Kapabacteria bacterium]|nr:putative sugar nucleotidyl transferase [Candidatus Kapabacteria bacterium]
MKTNSIVLIEPKVHLNFYPFSVLHTVFELRCGVFRLFEKIVNLFPNSNISFLSERPEHLNCFLEKFNLKNPLPNKNNVLFLFANVLPTTCFFKELEEKYDEFLKNIENKKNIVCFTRNNLPIAYFFPELDYNFINNNSINNLETLSFPNIEINAAKILDYIWDAIEYNGSAIEDDFQYFRADYLKQNKNTTFLNRENIFISETADIMPGTVLDASNGVIIIDDNVKIMPNSVIIGPCFIGKNSTIKVAAKIYEKTSIGEFCKVGGEVENSIIQSYSNKQHDGFLGHSFISEWVNLGADTNTSDLKNNYGEIKINIGKDSIKTGRMFLGLLCGDHTKSAINTSFTTGTAAGICSILFHSGFLPSYIPSFTWGGNAENSVLHQIERAVELAKVVMARRNRLLSKGEELLIRNEFEGLSD